MSLPIIGGGRPPRAPTHQPLDLRRLMQLAPDLEEAFEMTGQEHMTLELVEELAADLGASESQICVAAAMMTNIRFDETATTRFEVCMGGCQSFGAVPIFESLVRLRAQRQERGETSFGVVPKRCLDKCERAAVVIMKTPDGTAGMAHATPEAVVEAVTQALS